jgi:hypothetical protein
MVCRDRASSIEIDAGMVELIPWDYVRSELAGEIGVQILTTETSLVALPKRDNRLSQSFLHAVQGKQRDDLLTG